MNEYLIPIVISIIGPALLGIFGFLWRVSSKLHLHEKLIDSQNEEIKQLRKRVHDLANHSFANESRISSLSKDVNYLSRRID